MKSNGFGTASKNTIGQLRTPSFVAGNPQRVRQPGMTNLFYPHLQCNAVIVARQMAFIRAGSGT
jgi:hypothetical protein